MAESGEVDAVASGHASTRGSACSTEKTMAELVDMMTRRKDDGGHGYDDGAVTGALAMVGNGEGRETGGNGVSRASGCDVEASRAQAASR